MCNYERELTGGENRKTKHDEIKLDYSGVSIAVIIPPRSFVQGASEHMLKCGGKKGEKKNQRELKLTVLSMAQLDAYVYS